MKPGHNTGAFGRQLTAWLEARVEHTGWRVFYDHEDATIDANVAATKGFFGASAATLNRLADIDVLVARPDDVASVLIEIGERECSTKKILGNVLAMMLCDRIDVRVRGEKQTFSIGPSTKFIVAGTVPTTGHRLRKVTEVIQPRLRQLQGLPRGLSPANVELIFDEDIADVLPRLEGRVKEHLSGGGGTPHLSNIVT